MIIPVDEISLARIWEAAYAAEFVRSFKSHLSCATSFGDSSRFASEDAETVADEAVERFKMKFM